MSIIRSTPKVSTRLVEVTTLNVTIEQVIVYFGEQEGAPDSPSGFYSLWDANSCDDLPKHMTVVSEPFFLSEDVVIDPSLIPGYAE